MKDRLYSAASDVYLLRKRLKAVSKMVGFYPSQSSWKSDHLWDLVFLILSLGAVKF